MPGIYNDGYHVLSIHYNSYHNNYKNRDYYTTTQTVVQTMERTYTHIEPTTITSEKVLSELGIAITAVAIVVGIAIGYLIAKPRRGG